MQQVIRFSLIPLLAAGVSGNAWATENAPPSNPDAEYKAADANFYPKDDLLKAHPSAAIMPETNFSRQGDSYLLPPHKKASKVIYLEHLSDWVEPITPPDATAPLSIAPDAMQIREPQGDVQVALPAAPASFVPATDGMTLPNGAVIKTGANGTAAVLFGGVDSARLIPNSEAAVQQTVTPQSHAAEVDLTTGAVFSKVGTQLGVKGEYEVHTPFGNAVAHGTDFVTVIESTRTDVWIAQGTVYLEEPDSKKAANSTSDGAGALKLLRFPPISDPHLALVADTESLTAVLDFIPLANQKLKALREKMADGATLSASEQAYLSRIKEVPSLIKLALVEPAIHLAAVPSAVNPPPVAAAAIAPATPSAAPIRAVVRVDGKVNFQGVTLIPAEFKLKLEAMVKANPDVAIAIKAGKKVPYENFAAVMDICHSAQVKTVSVAGTAPTPGPIAPAAAESPATNLPAPSLLMHPSMQPMPANPSAENLPTTNAPATASP